MVNLDGLKRPKVALTVYVEPEVKRGLKIAAALVGTTTSKIVAFLCEEYLEDHPVVQQALREGE